MDTVQMRLPDNPMNLTRAYQQLLLSPPSRRPDVRQVAADVAGMGFGGVDSSTGTDRAIHALAH